MNTPAGNLHPTRSYFHLLSGALVWLALPAIAFVYAVSFNRLPSRVATHFDLSGRPNGWMSRPALLVFFLLVAASFAALSAWLASRVRKPDATAWATLLLFYALAGMLVWVELQLIGYNQSGRPITAGPVLVAIAAAIIVMVVALSTGRGPALAEAGLIAEESHASAFYVFPMLGLVAFDIYLVIAVENPGFRLALSLVAVLMLAASAMAGAGFRYRFTTAGVDIRMLGLRLRSIPAEDIRGYSADRWSLKGGYGIRGVGERRAYVWGNRGVRITTREGEVFLGHDRPERIVRDLDRISGRPHRDMNRQERGGESI